MQDQAEGWPGAASRRNKKREELEQLLRKLAGYVDVNCGKDLAVLLSRGFAAWNRNRAPSPVPRGEPVAVKPLMIRGVRLAVSRVGSDRGSGWHSSCS